LAITVLPSLPGRSVSLPKIARSVRFGAAAMLLGIIVFAVYAPGLSGGFHFDDLSNLSVLGDYGGVNSLQTLVAYLESAVASDLGRPVSMLSFLLNAQTWPADARPFLITNVALHIANTLLLALIVFALLRRAGIEQLRRNALGIAVFSALIWACHPFLVSTTLYIVQRMAMLSAFFSLAAIALYVGVRLRVLSRPEAEPVKAMLAAAGIGLLTLLSVLSKENGALTPLLILVVEFFLIRPLWRQRGDSRWFKWWLLVVLALPALVLALLLLQKAYAIGLFEQVGNRPFTGIERMLAQPLILLYYLYCLFVPQPGYPGLFYDGHPLRLADPGELLPWLGAGALAAGLVLAFRFRTRYPLAAGAFVFFLAGHLMESTVTSLEPIFEHRNYLPSTMLFVPVAAAVLALNRKLVRNVLVVAIPAVLCLFTFSHAALWGEPDDLRVYWAYNNPKSERAQVVAADTLLRAARFDQALALLERANENIPQSAPILATRVIAERKLGIPAEESEALALEAFRQGDFGTHVPKITDSLLKNHFERGEEVMPAEFVGEALDLYIERSDYQHRIYQTNLRANRIQLSLSQNHLRRACEDAEKLLELSARIDIALRLAAHFATHGHYRDALDLLAIARSRLDQPADDRRFPDDWYRREIAGLEDTIDQDIQASNGNGSARKCDLGE